MIEIQLDNGTTIPLHGKSVLILPAGSRINNIINNEDDYDVIMIIAGIDRTVNIELHQPAIIIVEAGIRTIVNVTGGMALPISQAVLIAGLDNTVNGLATQNRGRIISAHRNEFDLGAIATFDKIEIGR
ncbi:MAG: hypothetical protein WCH59_04400 [Chitinophagia bacterium]|jgi:hypothetical protein